MVRRLILCVLDMGDLLSRIGKWEGLGIFKG